jgi:hypothetical protein
VRAVAPAARGRLARAQDHLDGAAGGRRGVSFQHDVHASPQDAALWDQTAGPCECEEQCCPASPHCCKKEAAQVQQAAGCTVGASTALGAAALLAHLSKSITTKVFAYVQHLHAANLLCS